MHTPHNALAAALSLFSFFVASSASSADWANQLFPVKTHNFGSVAVAAKAEFVFPIENRTGQDIHIRNVRASCGCTTPILGQDTIKAGETGTLTARFNTGTFRGKKGATLTVVIDRPSYAEVQLRVDGYIRRDIVFNPGAVEFGKVEQGAGAETEVSVAYAGRGDWQILGVESTNEWLEASIEETGRTGQRVDYRIRVRLDGSAAVGYLRDNLILRTNDRRMQRVPLAVTGQIELGLRVAPEAFSVDEMVAGETLAKRLVVTGKEPFRITDIQCEGFEVRYEPSEEARKTHVISVELLALPNSGPLKSELVVTGVGAQDLRASSVVTGTIIEQ